MRAFFGIVFIAAVILLQIWLSNRERRWPGLVLPGLAFLYGLCVPLSMAVPADGVTIGFALQMLLVWLLSNIPTAVLLAIYFGCRGKQRRSRQLDKMSIQDL